VGNSLQIHIQNSHSEIGDASDYHMEDFHPDISDVETRVEQKESQNVDFASILIRRNLYAKWEFQ
jgi:hypothetical protein